MFILLHANFVQPWLLNFSWQVNLEAFITKQLHHIFDDFEAISTKERTPKLFLKKLTSFLWMTVAFIADSDFDKTTQDSNQRFLPYEFTHSLLRLLCSL